MWLHQIQHIMSSNLHPLGYQFIGEFVLLSDTNIISYQARICYNCQLYIYFLHWGYCLLRPPVWLTVLELTGFYYWSGVREWRSRLDWETEDCLRAAAHLVVGLVWWSASFVVWLAVFILFDLAFVLCHLSFRFAECLSGQVALRSHLLESDQHSLLASVWHLNLPLRFKCLTEDVDLRFQTLRLQEACPRSIFSSQDFVQSIHQVFSKSTEDLKAPKNSVALHTKWTPSSTDELALSTLAIPECSLLKQVNQDYLFHPYSFWYR